MPNNSQREQWATKVGVILAVAGSAVGLGNFLRFPGQAAANGGGAFMIPYFISLVILGIPICWAEWTLGRQGGRLGFNSAPGVIYALVKNPVLRVFGALAILIPVVIYMYYVYVEAWCLAYAWDYLTGSILLGNQVDAYVQHFANFVGMDSHGLAAKAGKQSSVVYFVVVVFILNFYLIYRGLTKGIETFCRYAVPLLLVAAVAVLVRVLTLPPQPVPEPWQYSLAEALPEQRWQALRDELADLETEAAALATQPAETDEAQEALDQARNALLDAVKQAVADYYAGIRRGEPGYQADVPVSAPYGFLASFEGLRIALGELADPEAAAVHRQWIKQTRTALDTDTKWHLLYLEEKEKQLLELTGSDDLKEQNRARRELSGTHAQRLETLKSRGLPPGLSDADASDPRLRAAAAEVAELDRTVSNGLGFMWNPRTAEGGDSIIAALSDPQVWMAAASQIFFSLSVGFGIIMTYSTYLRRKDDVALTALTAASTNEFCEVCLGGLITIPAAFIFLGLGSVQGASTFSLGFFTTPAVFAQMPAGRLFGFVWFFTLFLAAITSSLSMLQPATAFLEEGFGLGRKGSVAALGLLTALGTLVVTYFSGDLVGLDTMDFWVGNFCIFVMATVMVIIFGWVIGADKALKWARDGADLALPNGLAFVLKYIAPAYLLVIFVLWIKEKAPGYVGTLLENDAALFTVIFVLLIMVFFGVLVRLANLRWTAQGREVKEIDV